MQRGHFKYGRPEMNGTSAIFLLKKSSHEFVTALFFVRKALVKERREKENGKERELL